MFTRLLSRSQAGIFKSISFSVIPNVPSYQRYVSSSTFDPLRILFCGSDEFSIASLRALYAEHQKDPSLIASIDVVCRSSKRVGRNLKTLREAPISGVATELSLPVHQIETFRGWQPPTPFGEKINLVVTVSFGLFIPRRILEGAKFRGVNVHPSMLPDFRGPAPLHHTLLCGERNIGVSLQTLSPQAFDEGDVLAQTEYPGFSHECSTVSELMNVVAPKGASILIQGLRNRLYLHPKPIIRSNRHEDDLKWLRHAPKITPEDRHIDWETWTSEKILRTHRVIGPLWNTAQARKKGRKIEKRIIWESGFSKYSRPSGEPSPSGRLIGLNLNSGVQSVIIKTCDGQTLFVDKVKLEGEKASQAWHALRYGGLLNIPDEVSTMPHDFALSWGKLR